MKNLKIIFLGLFIFTVAIGCEAPPLVREIHERPNVPVLLEDNTRGIRSDVGADWVRLNWKPVDNATHYRVYYKIKNTERFTVENIDNGMVTGLNPDTWYTFSISAVNDTGRESEKSSEIDVYTKLQTVVIKNTEKINHYTIKLEWDSVSGADYYAIFSGEDTDEIPAHPLKWGIRGTSETIDTLNESTEYSFWVQAYSGSWTDVTNFSDFGTTAYVSSNLRQPVLFVNEDNTTSASISLYWEAIRSAQSYEIRYCADQPGEDMENWNEKSTTSTNYVINGLEPNTFYYFTIKAHSANNESIFSETVGPCLTGIDPPAELWLDDVTSDRMQLRWTDTKASQYELIYWTDQMTEPLSTGRITNNYGSISSLTENTEYHFMVKSWDKNWNEGDDSELFSYYTLLTKPENVHAATVSASEVHLTWDAMTGADEYIVEVYKEESESVTKIVNIDDTKYTVDGLDPDTSYTFFVRAINGAAKGINPDNHIEGDPSDPATALTLLSTPVPLITRCFSNRIELSWQQPERANSYKVYYSLNSLFDAAIQYNPGQTIMGTTCTVTGLTSDTVYYFWVEAFYNINENYSEKSFSRVGRTLLTGPENLSAVTFSASEVDLAWDTKIGSNGYAVNGYVVEVYNTLILVKKTNIIHDTEYRVAGLNPNILYTFRVKAVNGAGTEGDSTAKEALTLLSKPNPRVTRLFNQRIELSWQPINGANSYNVYYSTNSSFDAPIQYNPGQTITDTTCTVTGLTSDTVYYFWVEAFYNNGENYSDHSPVVEGRTITSTVTIIFDFSNPVDPVLENIPDIIQVEQDNFDVTVRTEGSGWANTYKWYLDGEEKTVTGDTFTIDWHLRVGPHTLAVVVTRNGVPYSASASFKVK